MSNADSTTDIVFYDFIDHTSPDWHVTMVRLFERMENKLDNDFENAMSTDDHIKWYLLIHVDIIVPRNNGQNKLQRRVLSTIENCMYWQGISKNVLHYRALKIMSCIWAKNRNLLSPTQSRYQQLQ